MGNKSLLLLALAGLAFLKADALLSQLNLDICLPNNVPPVPTMDSYDTCAAQVAASRSTESPDKGKTTPEIIASHNFTGETHTVTTSDGYILTLHRIIGGPNSPPAPGKPSVYLHHGMGGASDHWLFQSGTRNLAFKLADAGYDVWLANCRGTTYSQGHVSKNAQTDVTYWDFSWHEIAMFDLPATINKITAVSGNQRMYYVGYSMGTTAYFIALSEMPELNKRIIAGFMLSPVAYNGRSTNPIRLLSPLVGLGGAYLLDPVLRGRLDQPEDMQRFFNVSLGDFCTPTAARCGICDEVIFALFNFDAPQMDYPNLPNILQKFPNVISIKTFFHYAQSMTYCNFRQFDYGAAENLIRYKSLSPPTYDLSKVNASTYFFYGDQDNLAVPDDVLRTYNAMSAGVVKENIRVDWSLFNHLDFQMAKDADTLVFNRVLQLIQSIPPQ